MSRVIVLDEGSPAVQYLCKKDKRLAKVISMVGPITYEPYVDSYAFLVGEIIEQMLSIKAADKIRGRLKDLCGGIITPEKINLLSDDEIKSVGTSRPKVRFIRALTTAVLSGQIDFDSFRKKPDSEVLKELTAICGIGTWSAKMYLIFVLDRPDILPFEDVAFLQGYMWTYKTDDCSKKAIEKKCRKWSPYSSIAARYMYRALDAGLTKTEFHLFKD